MAPVFLNALVDEDISHPDAAETLAAAILEAALEVFPERIGNYEPIREPCASGASIRAYWTWPFLETRTNPRSDISVWFRRPRRLYTAIYLSVYDSEVPASSLASLLTRIGHDFSVAYGMVQVVSSAYRARAERLGCSSTQTERRDISLSVLQMNQSATVSLMSLTLTGYLGACGIFPRPRIAAMGF